MKDFATFITSGEFLESLVVFAIMCVILKMIKQYLVKKVAYSEKRANSRTFMGILVNVLQYVVIIVAIFIILWINGVNITGIVTGLGIVATIIGLALQDTIKNVLSGINIYNNNFYKVGDVVMWDNQPCQVKYFNATITKFKSLSTLSTYTVNNSNITQIEKIKNGSAVSITFDFDEDKDTILKAFDNICEEVGKIDGITGTTNLGITGITKDGTKYTMVYDAPPAIKYSKTPKIYSIIYDELKRSGVSPNDSLIVEMREKK